MFHEEDLFFLTFMQSETWCKSLESFLPFVVRKLPSAFVFVICSDNTAASRVASAAGRAAVPCMLPAPAPSDLISCLVIFTSLTLLTTLPFFCTGKTEYEGGWTLGSSLFNFCLNLCRILIPTLISVRLNCHLLGLTARDFTQTVCKILVWQVRLLHMFITTYGALLSWNNANASLESSSVNCQLVVSPDHWCLDTTYVSCVTFIML